MLAENLNNLTRKQKISAILLLEEKKRRFDATRLNRYYEGCYPWQRDFIAATHDHFESCLCAANQIGKTRTGTIIDAYHLTGEYPDDYPGYKFDFPPLCWGLGFSMEKTRDLIQNTLFGRLHDGQFDGGLIPKEKILGYESATGTPNACRTVRVKHKLGTSVIQFWSYSQGQHAIMGDVVDWVHVDEEPRDQTIRPQVLTRTINGDKGKGGRLIYTLTPENGKTDLVIKFKEDPESSQFFMQKGWDDAPHMTEEKRERLMAQYPEHQRDMRTKGEPMLGHGRIYDIGDEYIACDPIPIPDHWFVINGMDFGYDHPQAHIQLVEDRDNNIFYVTHAWKASKVSANDAWGAVRNWALRYPTAWPHDGLQHEKGRDNAMQQKTLYADAGFNMLTDMAIWPDIPDGKGGMKGGGTSVEQGLHEISELMRTGRLKIFKGLADLFDEIRQYHRNDKQKVVKVRDDLLDALRYAYMMRRYSVRYGENPLQQRAYIPKPIRTMGR